MEKALGLAERLMTLLVLGPQGLVIITTDSESFSEGNFGLPLLIAMQPNIMQDALLVQALQGYISYILYDQFGNVTQFDDYAWFATEGA